MQSHLLVASGILLAALATAIAPVPAHAKSMKACAAEWDQMKADNKTGGTNYQDFTKQCLSGKAAKSATAPEGAADTSAAKPMSSKRQAMIARERACAADWKADKAAGKIEAGMKWPQYWSACNKRKKAEGM